MQKSSTRFNWDVYSIVFTAVIFSICIFGLFAVYSASCYQSEKLYGDGFLYLKKQVIGVAIGLILYFSVMFLGTEKLKKLKYVFPITALIILALVFVPGIGVENYGARRWINLFFFTLQPSELCKPALIIFAACYYEKHYGKTNTFIGMLPVLGLGVAFSCLIIAEPNLSVTFYILVLTFILLIAMGLNKRLLIMLIILGVCLIPILILLEPYRLARLIAFVDPWANPKDEGYQLIQSLYAIGNGGLFGTGYLNSRQSLKFLPFAESDFIFSVICEEFGLFGVFAVMSAYLILVIIGVIKARNALNRYDSMLCFGASMCFGIQTAINIAVVSGSIPPTGLPLPLISSGNTQIIVFMLLGGIISSTKAEFNNKGVFSIK